jgi:hypothetical protein
MLQYLTVQLDWYLLTNPNRNRINLENSNRDDKESDEPGYDENKDKQMQKPRFMIRVLL